MNPPQKFWGCCGAEAAGGAVLSAHKTLCWFVLVGWAIYPIGYMAGTPGWYDGIFGGLDLDIVYTMGDAVIKIEITHDGKSPNSKLSPGLGTTLVIEKEILSIGGTVNMNLSDAESQITSISIPSSKALNGTLFPILSIYTILS